MKRSYVLIVALISGISGLLPHPAVSTDIPFYVSNNSSKNWCVSVVGPWVRGTGSDTLSPGTQRNNFYTAETGLFSPFGKWVANLLLFRTIEGEMLCDPAMLPQVISFCMENRPSNEVDLTISADDKLTVNAPFCLGDDCMSCDSLVQATAFLGHTSGQRSQLDRDVFRFEGDAGDEVIVTLEPEGTMGSTGEEARLILRSQSGGPLREHVKGPLPLELEAVLPEPGSYEVVVVEARPGSSNPFRGHFQLTVRSTAEADLALEPLTSVEP